MTPTSTMLSKHSAMCSAKSPLQTDCARSCTVHFYCRKRPSPTSALPLPTDGHRTYIPVRMCGTIRHALIMSELVNGATQALPPLRGCAATGLSMYRYTDTEAGATYDTSSNEFRIQRILRRPVAWCTWYDSHIPHIYTRQLITSVLVLQHNGVIA